MRRTVIALAMCVSLAFSSLSIAFAAGQRSAPASIADEQKLYAEGEALAIVRGEAQLQGPGRTERIAQVSASAVLDALEDWDGRGSVCSLKGPTAFLSSIPRLSRTKATDSTPQGTGGGIDPGIIRRGDLRFVCTAVYRALGHAQEEQSRGMICLP